jgi:8-oxo-dGTP pyrophosphatase MutT (NUDIX family)
MTLAGSRKQAANGARALRPRDAASIVVIDRSSGTPRVLMGKRRPDQVFLPNKYVFPGGRVDRTDSAMASVDSLKPEEIEALSARTSVRIGAVRARAFALAAIRELFEETGLILGAPASSSAGASRTAPPPWRPFVESGFLPSLGALAFFARAITPPDRPRRYDTRFFAVDAGAIAHRTGILDDELSEIGWYALDDVRHLDVASITRHIVEDIASLLDGRQSEDAPRAIPFYRFVQGRFSRTFLHAGNGERP